MKSDIVRPSDDYRKFAITGYGVIFITFGVVGGWAATAPLDSAVVASGVVAAESNRKTIQHLEGGIVSAVKIREGELVHAGQVLFQLDRTQPAATRDITSNQLTSALAAEARLVAERDSADKVDYLSELADMSNELIQRNVTDQNRQFADRRASIRGQINLLRSRMEQLGSEIVGLERERGAKEQQVKILNDEIVGLRQLFEKGLTPKARLLALERERSALEGQIGRSIADKAKSETAIGETELQIKQIQQKFYEEVSREIVETRSKIVDLRERFRVAQDVLHRLDVLAPSTGTLQGLRVFSAGAVIRAGEPLADIVPSEDDLIIQAHFTPFDADNVRPGAKAEVRFPSFHYRTLPMIPGEIRSVSRDRLLDEVSKQPYFLALIRVDPKDLPPELQGRLKPGLPAEVVVPTGERTVAQYLIEPLSNILRKTMREH